MVGAGRAVEQFPPSLLSTLPPFAFKIGISNGELPRTSGLATATWNRRDLGRREMVQPWSLANSGKALGKTDVARVLFLTFKTT